MGVIRIKIVRRSWDEEEVKMYKKIIILGILSKYL